MSDFDCLLVGHHELEFQQYFNILENMASSGGRDHVAFTDLQLNHVRYRGKPYQAMDLLTEFYNEGLEPSAKKDFYNGDCLWTAITYLGSYLHKRGYSFDYINLFHWEKRQLKEKLLANNYRLIVLTGTMYVFEQNIWEVIAFIRKVKRDVKIIVGGPYISKEAEEREAEYVKPLFRYLNADFYCYSREGEQTLVMLLDALRNGTDIANVPNLAYREGKDFRITPRMREKNSLNDNMIDYSLFKEGFAKSGWANVRISDGCPYGCGFCSFPEHGNERYVIMNLDRTEKEFDAIKATGVISHIFFIDATMNVPPAQFKSMLRMMIRKNYDFKWHCFFRCDQTDEETIQLMKQAGCMGVFLGLESASEIVLNNMDKTAHKEDFRRTMPWFRKYGLRQMISVQVGFPGETYETLRDSLEFIEEIRPDFTRIQIWFCDPTTPVWRKRDKFALKGKAYGWSHYTMNAETAVELVVRSFMALEHITWVPDPGYNWVSFYANEKRGMTLDQQKLFLKFFSAAAKEKLLQPNLKEISAELLANFKRSAQYDRADQPDPRVLEKYSGARYLAAERYWMDEFQNGSPSAAIPETGDLIETAVHRVAPDKVAAIQQLYGVEFKEVAVACFAILTTKLFSTGESIIVTSLDEEEPFPVLFRPVLAAGAAEFFEDVTSKLEQARVHRLFCFFVLTNPLRMKEYGALCPGFPAGVLVRDSSDTTMAARLEHYPAVNRQIAILLTITNQDGRSGFSLSSPAGQFSRLCLDQTVSALSGMLENLSGSNDLRLEQLVGDFAPLDGKVAAAARESNEVLVQIR